MSLGVPIETAFLVLKERKSPEARRHKLEYDTKYESSPDRVKYREDLNRERRRRGIYGSHNHKDVSHTQGGGLTLENEHSNRARHFKNEGTLKPIEKSFQEIASRINSARRHLNPEKKEKNPPFLHPSVGQDWQPAALSALLGMVQPSALMDYGQKNAQTHYGMPPFDVGEYSDRDEMAATGGGFGSPNFPYDPDFIGDDEPNRLAIIQRLKEGRELTQVD